MWEESFPHFLPHTPSEVSVREKPHLLVKFVYIRWKSAWAKDCVWKRGFISWWVMTHLKILPHTSQMRLFWPKEDTFCRQHTLLSCKCLLLHFLSSSCQKSQICKGNPSKREAHKDLQTEFETSNPLGKTLATYLLFVTVLLQILSSYIHWDLHCWPLLLFGQIIDNTISKVLICF